MAIFTIESKYNKGDRVYYADNGPDDRGTVTEVIVTRDWATEELSLSYEVRFDVQDDPSATFTALQLRPVVEPITAAQAHLV